MNCEQFARFLDNYENLTNDEKSEMTEHASMCRKCQEELDFYLSIISTARSLPQIDPPADFLDKLNERIDAEEKDIIRPNKVLYHIKRSWKQYAAAAACLALVAAVAANSSRLLNRVNEVDDGANKRETVANGKTENDGNTAVSPNAPAENTETNSQSSAEDVISSVISVANVVSGTNNSEQSARTGTAAQTFSRITSSETVSGETVTNDNTLHASVSLPKKVGDDYGVALGGTINSITKTEDKTYDIRPEDVPAALRASEIKEKYSLLENGESIAFGRYYIIDKDGNPIEEDTQAQGIGAIKVSSDDKEKAEEVIRQYPHDENGNVYTTNSENLTNILTDLSEEGVEYTDYTLAGSEDVKFRIDY